MAKSRNNLLGVGGQRKKLTRAEKQTAGPSRNADRQTAEEKKQELVAKMRERAQSASTSSADDSADDSADGSAGQDASAQS